MIRIVCISDTHLTVKKDFSVPDGDILIHSGDATMTGKLEEVREFFNWFKSFPHKHKIFVAGNHDWLFEKKPETARSMVPGGVAYLEDESIVIKGFNIYGSPYQPEFNNWAFNKRRGKELKKEWEKIPLDTNVLITHGPPAGILDTLSSGEGIGCHDLWSKVRVINPRLHVFGHNHAGYGQWRHNSSTLFVNASICNEQYKPVNAPIVVDLSDDKT